MKTRKRKSQSKKKKSVQQHNHLTKYDRKFGLKEEKKFREEFSFLYTRAFKLSILLLIILVGCVLRLGTVQVLSNRMFMGDDEYWHHHIIEQMVKLGYRPLVDYQSWVPQGREMVHPPLYHYLVFYVWKLFSPLSISIFDVMIWLTFFMGIIGTFVWFKLCTEVYGTEVAGFFGSALYSIVPSMSSRFSIGGARPQPLAELVSIFGLYVFARTMKHSRKFLLPLSGLVLGLACLFWEAAMYFLPLIVVYWILNTCIKKSTNELHFKCLITVSTAIIVALVYFYPIYVKYGLYDNTPSFMLKETMTFWLAGGTLNMLWVQILLHHVFLIGALISYPILIFYDFGSKEWLLKDYLALTWMTLGIIGFFVGLRLIAAFLPFGITMILVSSFTRIWQYFRGFEKIKFLIAIFLCILLIVSAGYTFYLAREPKPRYSELSSLRSLNGNEVPINSVILSWWSESSFFLGHGLRTLWDGYLEHMPSWTWERGREIASFYLSEDENSALEIINRLNVSFVFVEKTYAVPKQFKSFLEAYGLNEDAESFFGFRIIREGDQVVGYEFAPKEKAEDIMLTRLIWNNMTGNLLETMPMPAPTQHFQLVWKNEDAMLYKVV